MQIGAFGIWYAAADEARHHEWGILSFGNVSMQSVAKGWPLDTLDPFTVVSLRCLTVFVGQRVEIFVHSGVALWGQ